MGFLQGATERAGGVRGFRMGSESYQPGKGSVRHNGRDCEEGEAGRRDWVAGS